MIRIRLEPTDADVVIAGAGPAGATAAAYLARAGLRVIIVDQARFPRDKVCGDLVGPVALSELERLGVTDMPGFQCTNPIREVALFVNGRRALHRDFPTAPSLPRHARVIPRTALDAWIVEAARRAGARLVEGRRVQSYALEPDGVIVYTASGDQMTTLRARGLIGADGSSSVIAQQLRGRPLDARDRIVSMRAYFEGVRGPHDRLDVYVGRCCFPGYYWVFPIGGGRANVGLGLALDTVPATETRLRERLRDVIASDPALAERLRGARMTGKLAGWPLAIYNPRLPVVGDRVLLAGDAANLVNPVNGEGIQAALLSGRWAAEAIVEGMRDEVLSAEALGSYAARLRAELGSDMAWPRLIVQCIRNTALAPLWLSALDAIADRASADARYSDVASGIMAGVVPAGGAVEAHMILGTLEQALLNVGLDSVAAVLGGPSALAHAGRASLRWSAELLATLARSPGTWARWTLQTAADAARLPCPVAPQHLGSARPSVTPPYPTHLRVTLGATPTIST